MGDGRLVSAHCGVRRGESAEGVEGLLGAERSPVPCPASQDAQDQGGVVIIMPKARPAGAGAAAPAAGAGLLAGIKRKKQRQLERQQERQQERRQEQQRQQRQQQSLAAPAAVPPPGSKPSKKQRTGKEAAVKEAAAAAAAAAPAEAQAAPAKPVKWKKLAARILADAPKRRMKAAKLCRQVLKQLGQEAAAGDQHVADMLATLGSAGKFDVSDRHVGLV